MALFHAKQPIVLRILVAIVSALGAICAGSLIYLVASQEIMHAPLSIPMENVMHYSFLGTFVFAALTVLLFAPRKRTSSELGSEELGIKEPEIGTKENPCTGTNSTPEQRTMKYFRCDDCKAVQRCTPWNDAWSKPSMADKIFCERCTGLYMGPPLKTDD